MTETAEVVDQSTLERELQAARKTIEALIARQLRSGPTHAPDRFAVFKAMAALENIIANRTEALRESEQRYRSLYDNAPDMYVTIAPGGRIVHCNETFARALEARTEDIAGRPLESFLTPDSVTHLHALMDARFAGVTEPFMTLVGKDGNEIVTTVKSVAVDDDDGELASANLTLRDVTEQRLMERELQHTQRLAAIGELAAGMAHEINNPLTVIRGQSDLLLLASNLTEDQKARIRTIQGHSTRIAGIVSNLQTFARKSGGSPSTVRVADVVEYALEVVRPRMRTINVRLQTQGAPETLLVHAEEQRLSQVVVNLLNNACDAMAGTGSIDVSIRGDGAHVIIDVRDHGCGIPSEHFEKLFTPFFTTKDVGEGTGLGLPISYGIVKEYGGVIRAENAVGGGALFRVILPRARRPASVHPAPEPPAPLRLAEERRCLRVLVVDDEPVIRDLVEAVLEPEGYEVRTVPGAQEALDCVFDLHPDVVITDLRMPGMDGLSLRDELVRRAPYLDGRVLLTTGMVDHTSHNGMRCLPKPFTRLELLRAIESTVTSASSSDDR